MDRGTVSGLSIEPEPHAQIEPHVRKAVQEVVAQGMEGVALVDALTNRLSQLYSDFLLTDYLSMLGSALSAVPEAERKAKMFDMLMFIRVFERDRNGKHS